MTERRPTLEDVAERAGVSLKTTSRVLNGEKSVRPQTEQRVRLAMAELGFRPNYFARRLRLGADCSTIGVLVDDLSDSAQAAMARAIERYAGERSVLMILACAGPDGGSAANAARGGSERSLVSALCQRPVSGLIVTASGVDSGQLAAEQERGLPIVRLGRPADGLEADTVAADQSGAAAMALAHLTGYGHQHIAYLGGDERSPSDRELTLLGADALAVRRGLVDGAAAEGVTRELLGREPAPTALVTANEQLTLGALRARRALGCTDVAVVALGDFLAADLLGVTVVRHDVAELGRLAAERLFARLDGDRSPPTVTTVPVELVARGSGEVTPMVPQARLSAH